jgi:hypothetical protein
MRIFSSWRRRVVALTAITGIALVPVVYATVTFGPSRPTFTWQNPASHITFNSITNNPSYGDERYLIEARDASAGTDTYAKQMQVKDNQEVALEVYFHNNAASNLNLVAKNTTVKVALPSSKTTDAEVKATVSADNATPQSVWATADLTNTQPFTLEYITGSAKLWTNYVSGVAVSDNIVNSGALVGTSGTDGKVPGCSQYSGYVTIRVRVHIQTPPQVKFACTDLDVTQVDRTRFDFTAHAEVKNATVNSYVFTVKDADNKVVDTKTVNTSNLSAVYHFNQSKVGTYTITTVIHTNQGTTEVGKCEATITVKSVPPVTPPVTPPQTPSTTTLPNTGPGDVIGLFAGVSALGTAGHYVVSRRRQS